MKFFPTALLLTVVLFAASGKTVFAHETVTPHDESANANQTVNSDTTFLTNANVAAENVNVNAATNTNEPIDRQASIAKLKSPPTLKPLLLIPAALLLYLLYERLARRK